MPTPKSTPPLDLAHLTSADVFTLEKQLQRGTRGAAHRQEAAERIIDELYETFRDADGEPACALARCFQTCTYARLPLQYRDAADQLLDVTPTSPNMRCLTLLASRGLRTVWNQVATSTGHQCIPLPSVEVVRRAPMISALLDNIGVSIERVATITDAAKPAIPLQQNADGSNVFHVEKALGSPYIPAQEQFVKPHQVRSVVGMGGTLQDGEIFAVILFARVEIPAQTLDNFKTLGLSLQESLRPFSANQTFQPLRR